MDLKVPIAIVDELDEQIVESTGLLDLASGEIGSVRYTNYDIEANGLPAASEAYAFTSGVLSHDGKDVEFCVDVDTARGRYSVRPNELLDIKVRAARLFAGIDGKELLGGKAGAAAGRHKKLH